jgi:uncharacterized protein (TIGR03437 family)
LVSSANPAKSGEELVVYAVGEQAYSPVTSLAFTYAVGSGLLGTRFTQSLTSVYVGPVAGLIGLYQINFVVPSIPAGTVVCQVGSPSFQLYTNASITNLEIGGSALNFCVVP